jgi:hypothetical protein
LVVRFSFFRHTCFSFEPSKRGAYIPSESDFVVEALAYTSSKHSSFLFRLHSVLVLFFNRFKFLFVSLWFGDETFGASSRLLAMQLLAQVRACTSCIFGVEFVCPHQAIWDCPGLLAYLQAKAFIKYILNRHIIFNEYAKHT